MSRETAPFLASRPRRRWLLWLLALGLTGLWGCRPGPSADQRQEQLLREAGEALARGEFDVAIQRVDAVLASTAPTPRVYRVQGNIYWFARRYDAAAAAFERACMLDQASAYPDPASRLGAGVALQREGQPTRADRFLQEADELYGRILVSPPGETELRRRRQAREARLHRAVIAALRGHRASAISQIERLRELEPDWDGAAYWIDLIEGEALADALLGG